MSFLNLFGRSPQITESQIPDITRALAGALEVQRDLYYAGMLAALKSQRIDTSGMPKAIEEGSDPDSVLRALQLVSVVGFTYRYMDVSLCLPFGDALVAALDNGRVERVQQLRETYLDCEGDFACLTSGVARDLHAFLGAPEPRSPALNGIAAGVGALIVMSQACAAAAVGDVKTEQRLKSQVGLA